MTEMEIPPRELTGAKPALSPVEGPALSPVEGPALSPVEGPGLVPAERTSAMKRLALYYAVKPNLRRDFQIALRRRFAVRQREAHRDTWPILPTAGTPPASWPGWPEGKRFGVVLTHDVESARGFTRCERVMALEQHHGFRSSFNFVPKAYDVDPAVREILSNVVDGSELNAPS